MFEWTPLLLASWIWAAPAVGAVDGGATTLANRGGPAAPGAAFASAPPRVPADTTPYPDDWFAEDKLRHFFLSFAATSLAYGAVRTAGLGHGPAEVVAGAGAAAAGVWKEFHDRGIGRPFSRRDLVWDGLGILAGLVLATQTR